MTTLKEGNLQITFPPAANARKFDDDATHGLSHCMKSVDFIVEEDDRVLFIELKDPENPRAPDRKKVAFVESLNSGRLEDDLKYKYRDSFLYEWARGNVGKPIHYWILIAIGELTDADLLARTDEIKRTLPLRGPKSGMWRRSLAAGCVVFNIQTWNQHLPEYPITRI